MSEEVNVFLVSVDNMDITTDFLETMGVEAQTCLLDEDRLVYSGYDETEAGVDDTPFPLRVVIDRDGIIRWMDDDVDIVALRSAVEDALRR